MAQLDDGYGLPPEYRPQIQDISRQLKLADMLRQQSQDPLQGQMVSGHYVAPSITQQLSKALSGYAANKKEESATNAQNKLYKDYQGNISTQTQRLADALKPKQVADGYNTTSPERQFDQFGSPVQGQDMTPIQGEQKFKEVQPNQQDISTAMLNYYGGIGHPELGAQYIGKQAELAQANQLKSNEPYTLKSGEHRFVNGVDVASVAQDNTPEIAKINPSEYTPASMAKFMQTKNPADLLSSKPEAAPVTRQMRSGNQDITQQWDTASKSWTTIAKGAAFAPREAPQIDPGQVESMAQMIANGQMPAPTGYASRSPAALAIMQRVGQINPNYSAVDFNTGKKAAADFATGKTGNAVRSFNVSISHLNTLSKLADGLGNGNMQLVNQMGNAYAQQTGNPAPTNFNAAKKIVGDEIVKAIVGAGGGVADREEAAKTISAANSPAQLKGVINTYKDLMNGQLKGLQQQYEVSTGKKDFNKFLSSDSQTELNGPAQSARHPILDAADAIIGRGK